MISLKQRIWHFRQEEQGFTLIELMVSLMVLGLLASLSVSLLHMAILSQEKARRFSNGIESVESVQFVLRPSFERMLVEESPSKDLGPILFQGRPDMVAFYSFLPLSFREKKPVLIRLSLENTKDKNGDLVLAWSSESKDGSWRKVVLLHDVVDLHLRYFGTLAYGSPRWSDTWINLKQLPCLIGLNVRFPDGDPRIWPELIVAPSVETERQRSFLKDVRC